MQLKLSKLPGKKRMKTRFRSVFRGGSIPPKEKNQIWIPSVTFVNTATQVGGSDDDEIVKLTARAMVAMLRNMMVVVLMMVVMIMAPTW